MTWNHLVISPGNSLGQENISLKIQILVEATFSCLKIYLQLRHYFYLVKTVRRKEMKITDSKINIYIY